MRNLKKMTVMDFTDDPHGMMADTMKRDVILILKLHMKMA